MPTRNQPRPSGSCQVRNSLTGIAVHRSVTETGMSDLAHTTRTDATCSSASVSAHMIVSSTPPPNLPGWARGHRGPAHRSRGTILPATAGGFAHLPGSRHLALGLDALEERGGRLVGRIPVHETALEGPFEDGLAEARTPCFTERSGPGKLSTTPLMPSA